MLIMFYNLCFVKKQLKYLIILQAVLFSVLLLIIFYFNRFAADDYYFIGELRTKSFQEIYSDLYFNWHGRWTFNFLILSILKLNITPYFLFLYNLISCTLLYFGIFKFLSALNNFFNYNLERKIVGLYAVIFLSVFFFCTISPGESWFWYASSINYLWSTIAFFYGLSYFLKKKLSFLDYTIYTICLIYIGGSSEPLAIICIMALCYSVYLKRNVRNATVGLILIFSSFLIVVLSPGTVSRDALTPNLGVIDLILYLGYGSMKFVFFTIYKTFIPALFFSLPFYFLGNSLKAPYPNFNQKKQFYISIGFIALIILMNQFIVIYPLGGLAPDRATIASSIFISITIVRYFFLLGTQHSEKYKWTNYLLFLNPLSLIIIIIILFPIHLKYAKAVDKRLTEIKTLEMFSKPIYLEPLPNSGYIYSSEIDTNQTHFSNQHLRSGLGIRNDIARSSN
jgi:Family of unknown function (DUF6056)